jgi:threonine synthase
LQPVEESEVEILDADRAAPPRKSRGHTREDFRTGDTVSFTDRGMQVVIGRITRMNPKTATIQTASGDWRVSYALLQPVVEL